MTVPPPACRQEPPSSMNGTPSPRALHVVRSLEPRNGGTSVSVPALASALAGTGRYTNSLIHFSNHTHDESDIPGVSVIHRPSRQIDLLLPGPSRNQLAAAISDAHVVQLHGIWG